MGIRLADTLEPMADFPSAYAKDIAFDDGDTLQEKLDTGSLGGGGGTIEVDSEFDVFSKNPVQNKVITKKIEEIESLIKDESFFWYDGSYPSEEQYKTNTRITSEMVGTEVHIIIVSQRYGESDAIVKIETQTGEDSFTISGDRNGVMIFNREEKIKSNGINDSVTSSESTWSSVKIDSKLDGIREDLSGYAKETYVDEKVTHAFDFLTEEQKLELKGDKGDKGDKGEQGIQGEAGKNGTNGVTPTIKVSAGSNINTVGTPSVTASTSGTTTTFTFNNLKGAKGDKGDNGSNGTTPTIKASAGSNIGSVGTPSVTATTSGTTTTFAFNYLKGAKGDKGDTGATGSKGATGATGATPMIHVNGMGGGERTMAELGPQEGIIAICTNVSGGSFFTSVTDGTVKCNGSSFTSSKTPTAGQSYVIVNSSATSSARIYCKNNGGSAWTIIGDVL